MLSSDWIHWFITGSPSLSRSSSPCPDDVIKLAEHVPVLLHRRPDKYSWICCHTCIQDRLGPAPSTPSLNYRSQQQKHNERKSSIKHNRAVWTTSKPQDHQTQNHSRTDQIRPVESNLDQSGTGHMIPLQMSKPDQPSYQLAQTRPIESKVQPSS